MVTFYKCFLQVIKSTLSWLLMDSASILSFVNWSPSSFTYFKIAFNLRIYCFLVSHAYLNVFYFSFSTLNCFTFDANSVEVRPFYSYFVLIFSKIYYFYYLASLILFFVVSCTVLSYSISSSIELFWSSRFESVYVNLDYSKASLRINVWVLWTWPLIFSIAESVW